MASGGDNSFQLAPDSNQEGNDQNDESNYNH